MHKENAGHRAALPTRKPLLRAVISACLFAALMVALAYIFDGKTGLEKTLIRLVFPIGLMWLSLTTWVFYTIWQCRWRHAAAAACLWCLFTLLGTTPFSDACLRKLEYQVPSFRPGIDPNLDVLVVLGGGTIQGPARAQAGGSGDRLVLAAQLLVGGFTQELITTGDATPGFGRERISPREQTVEIWQQLGIDPARIGELRGINTYQEIQSLKELRAKLPGKRIGLLTSAFHLPRALRLARAQGMSDLIPVAADYQSHVEAFSFVDLIPHAHAFDQLARCQHEWMAAFFGR